MACALGIEQNYKECGLCRNLPIWKCKMAKCKYPNEVCANMTVYRGAVYCDSVPCSLKDELPKRTNADRIREMTNEELAELSVYAFTYMSGYRADTLFKCHNGADYNTKEEAIEAELEWLESECDVE